METDKKSKINRGFYPTPVDWVNFAHRRLDLLFGEDWRDEFVVWDNCAGYCALTKDYIFKNLYISSLTDDEVEQGKQFNKDAEHFQFDFLNDEIPNPTALFDVESKLPKSLVDAFRKNKKILFLINPPYGQNSGNSIFGKVNSNISFTAVRKMMQEDKLGKSSQNLYVQFLYRIMKIKRDFELTNLYIAVFCPPLFLTGPSFKNYRKIFFEEFQFFNGFLFKASHFDDVADNWGILFSVWRSGETKIKTDFIVDLVDKNKNGKIESFAYKNLYNLDSGSSMSDWAREPIKDLKTQDAPNLSSGCIVKETGLNRGRFFPDALGYISNESNNIGHNSQCVALFSSPYSHGDGFGISEDNFERCTAAFAARRVQSLGDWAREPVKDLKTEDAPNLSAGCNVKETNTKNIQNALGYISNKANNIGANSQFVALFSSSFSNAHGFGINCDNFERCTAAFTARSVTSLSDWAREPIKDLKTQDAPNLTAGCNVKETNTKNIQNALGYISNTANNIGANSQFVALFSSAFSHAHGFGINDKNIERVIVLFSARASTIPDWANYTDEYMSPDENHPKYMEFVADSVVFSLFNSKSNQSSLRNVEYKNKTWRIKNHFFWMPAPSGHKNRFVYNWLQNVKLSPEAQAVLDYASQLVKDTYQYRDEFHEQNPKYQVINWDAGFYQLKWMWKQYCPDRLDELKRLYKILNDKLAPMVYELGFLK